MKKTASNTSVFFNSTEYHSTINTEIKYKNNHELLPILIMPDHRLLVYTDNPLYKKIYPHLISIAEPIYRPKYRHQYRITKFSLYTAMALHYSGAEIVQILTKISKNIDFPATLATEILSYMKYAGEVRFALEKQSYYLFTNKAIALKLKDLLQQICEVEIKEAYEYHLEQIKGQLEKQMQQESNRKNIDCDSSGKSTKGKIMTKYKILGDYFKVTRILIDLNIPIVQEFDFTNSSEIPEIQIRIINEVKLRYYQQRALKNIFIEGKARSGIIILPCGAGKSLVAVAAIAHVRRKSVIFCESQVSAEQWRAQLLKWTTIDRQSIIVFSPKWKGKNPNKINQCSIFITTYSMVGLSRVIENQYLNRSQQISWGVCVADEVHKLPAQTFQLVLQKYKFHLKIGLTATPYRQDHKIDNLFYMIGPKLFEQNWLELVNQGCLAKPYCVEILCQMQSDFADSYYKTGKSDLLHTANPQKFKVLQYLLKKHSACQDKILVFCDRPKIIEEYARLLKKPYIHGEVSEEQRVKIYNLFKNSQDINILFLSRVGDTAIDLPCANVGIQIGMHFKSRRQEIQRMGRIMRAKDNPNDDYNAFFYTLVSAGTRQVQYSRIRQKCLVDQGFGYQIKQSTSINYHGMKLVPINCREFLLKLLVEHDEGDKLLKETRKPTKVQIKDVLEHLDYCFYQDTS